ncbi:hypothetical protein [Kosakonia sp. MUSA4]|uniref:hypothetical protein n=1 Tax=Kosakonia sp. MUSA4 TaxID=2067958 RepID=UPI00159A40BE|nr:hypothetical protein [Kosakonia sp. MUSA4]QJT82448.1 hypothetical protein C0557_21400 [Kosakonia sp. MUSA4]
MKRLIVLTLALLPALATHAGQITMVNPQEERTENGKTLCVYENSQFVFSYHTSAQSCPYTKTFDANDAE